MSYLQLQAPAPGNSQYVPTAAAVTTQYPSLHQASSQMNSIQGHFLPPGAPGGEATGGSALFLPPQPGGFQTPSLLSPSTSQFLVNSPGNSSQKVLEFRDGDFYAPPDRSLGEEIDMGASGPVGVGGHSGDLPDSGEILRELLLERD